MRISDWSSDVCSSDLEGEAHEVPPAVGTEVDAGRRRHADLCQHALAERLAVVGQRRDVRVDVEGAVGRRQALEPRLRPLAQQKAAVPRVSGHVAVEPRSYVAGRLAGETPPAGRGEE